MTKFKIGDILTDGLFTKYGFVTISDSREDLLRRTQFLITYKSGLGQWLDESTVKAIYKLHIRKIDCSKLWKEINK